MKRNKVNHRGDNQISMKMIFLQLVALLCASCGLTIAGCNTRPNPGIEAGNPNVSVKSMRVLPKNGDEIYVVILLDDSTAVVSQIQDGVEPTLLDEVTVPYNLERNVLSLQATFANERAIDLTASFSESGDAISGVLKVDGGFSEACFEVPGQTPSCSPSVDMTTRESDTATGPSPRLTTVIEPISLRDSEDTRDIGGLTSPPPTQGDPSSQTRAGADPYGAYCTTIDGRPACKVPLDLGDFAAPEAENKATPSEIAKQFTRTPGIVTVIEP